jgi:cytochrome P450
MFDQGSYFFAYERSNRAIMVDPQVFSDGEGFQPERFMETTDPRLVNHRFGCFGFGRRICPGMHVALQSLYIVIAR